MRVRVHTYTRVFCDDSKLSVTAHGLPWLRDHVLQPLELLRRPRDWLGPQCCSHPHRLPKTAPIIHITLTRDVSDEASSPHSLWRQPHREGVWGVRATAVTAHRPRARRG